MGILKIVDGTYVRNGFHDVNIGDVYIDAGPSDESGVEFSFEPLHSGVLDDDNIGRIQIKGASNVRVLIRYLEWALEEWTIDAARLAGKEG